MCNWYHLLLWTIIVSFSSSNNLSWVFKVTIWTKWRSICLHSCNADLSPSMFGATQTVYSEDVCQSGALLAVIPGSVGCARGTAEKPSSPFGPETVGLHILLFPLLPYLWCILNFASRSLPPSTLSIISLGLFHKVLQRSWWGANTQLLWKAPDFLGLPFLNWAFFLHLKGSFRFQFEALWILISLY